MRRRGWIGRNGSGPLAGLLVASAVLLLLGLPAPIGLGPGPSKTPQAPAVPSPASPTAPTAPSACAQLHPALSYPVRHRELAADLACAFEMGRPVPPAGLPTSPVAAASSPEPPAFGMYNFQMTYDAADQYLLLFGATGHGKLNGTESWAFQGGNWTRLYPSTSPESCLGSAMAYDPFDGYVVYLGGGNLTAGANCTSAGQTWAFSGGSWTRLLPAVAPPPRQAAAFTNDSADGYMLLFGGACGNGSTVGLCGDTWSFVGGTWTNRTTPFHPSPRAGAGMTFDASDGYVLLFGGMYWPASFPFPIMDTDTWNYSGGNWTQINTCAGLTAWQCSANDPPEPWPDGLTYDAAEKVVVYTCARENISSGPENYYTYHAGAWTNLNLGWPRPSTVPPDRLGEALSYDWRDGYAVLFGGVSPNWRLLDDTWGFQDDIWTHITPRVTTGSGRVVFRETGLPLGTTWGVSIGTATFNATNRSFAVTLADGSYAYHVVPVTNYKTNLSGVLDVDGLRSAPVQLTFALVTYAVRFRESGLPSGTYWQITLDGSTLAAAGRGIVFQEVNGTYNFTAVATGYTATPAFGSITINGTRVVVAVKFS